MVFNFTYFFKSVLFEIYSKLIIANNDIKSISNYFIKHKNWNEAGKLSL